MSNINPTINPIDRNILNKQFSPNIKLLGETSTANHIDYTRYYNGTLTADCVRLLFLIQEGE